MNEQLELPIRRTRVALADEPAAPKSEAVARRGRLRLVQEPPKYNEAEALTGFSDWVRNTTPPCRGWWDVRVDGTEDFERLWFDPSTDPVTGGGLWYEQRREGGLKFIGSQAEIGGTTIWRGLAAPWWLGYTWRVSGAKADRVRLA